MTFLKIWITHQVAGGSCPDILLNGKAVQEEWALVFDRKVCCPASLALDPNLCQRMDSRSDLKQYSISSAKARHLRMLNILLGQFKDDDVFNPDTLGKSLSQWESPVSQARLSTLRC